MYCQNGTNMVREGEGEEGEEEETREGAERRLALLSLRSVGAQMGKILKVVAVFMKEGIKQKDLIRRSLGVSCLPNERGWDSALPYEAKCGEPYVLLAPPSRNHSVVISVTAAHTDQVLEQNSFPIDAH